MNTHDTHTDPFPDTLLDSLLADWETLDNDEDAWTWYDADPDIAWGVQPEHLEPGERLPYYASLRDLLIDAGWEPCYHDARTRLHFNVKTGGRDAYGGFWDKLSELSDDMRDRVDSKVNQPYGLGDMDLQNFWELWLPDEIQRYASHNWNLTNARVYQCGRSGGYANSRDLERNGEIMIRLAQYLARSCAFYNSREYGEGLAERGIEAVEEDMLEEMASPRIERIEA